MDLISYHIVWQFPQGLARKPSQRNVSEDFIHIIVTKVGYADLLMKIVV